MDPLFQPIAFNRTEVKNRFFLTAMQMNYVTNYEVSDRLCEFYAERARGGTGAICVGFLSVAREGSAPFNIGGHEDQYIPGLTKLADAIKAGGARAAAQLNHTGRLTYPIMIPRGMQAIGPSALPCRMTRCTPREMTQEDIQRTIGKFADAARRVVEAGFDMVEVLMGTGYLVSSFLSPLTNVREDDWGGSEENRMRFGVEVLKAVRAAVGPDYPVIIRMNGNDMMEDGLGGDAHVRFAQALVANGADGLSINVGWHEARVPQITMGVPRANFAYLARRIKQAVDVPVIAAHRINNVGDARRLVERGFCDVIGMGRGLIADPYFARKAQQRRAREIIHCIGCSQGCFDHVFKARPVECMINPHAGHELDGPVVRAADRKTVAVVGGGPAGMAAAVTARQRGHEVTLFERGDRLGGQLALAAVPPGRGEFEQFAHDYAVQVERSGARVVLGHEVTAEELAQAGYDAVVLATGAEPLPLDVPGADRPNVLQAWDLLAGEAHASGRIVVVGGGSVGVETALMLAEEGTLPAETVKFLLIHGVEPAEELRRLATSGVNQVTLVEMLKKVGKDVGKSTRWTFKQGLDKHGVEVLVTTRVLEINDDGVVIAEPDAIRTLPADYVVLAAGARPFNPLAAELEERGVEVHVVGDATKVGTAFDAVHSGFKATRGL